jgi:hypothetical protein
MKALTAWIPVQDEDLLMKVARAEWRRHQGGRRLWEGGWEWERSRIVGGGGGGKEAGKGMMGLGEGKEVKEGDNKERKGEDKK